MQQEPQEISPALCQEATRRLAALPAELQERETRIGERLKDKYVDLAKRDLERTKQRIALDPNREARLNAHKCLRCYYLPRIAGAAMTSRACGLCGKDRMFSSTATDVLSVECANQHHLCAHCGADIDGDTQRKEYPESSRG